MKDYTEMAESILRRRDRYRAERKKRQNRLTAAVFCLCFCALLGAGAWQSGGSAGETPAVSVPASSGQSAEPASTASFGESSDNRTGAWTKGEDTNSDKTLSAGGAPLWAAADLTEEALYNAAGGLLPAEAPVGFTFESATFADYGYSVLWTRGLEELSWRIRDYTETDAACITRVEDTQNYDLALYPIPRADTVPEALMEIVDNPIFRAEELTCEAVWARAYTVEEIGDSSGYRMHFSVLHGDKLITITSKGISPNWLYEQLANLSA